MGQSKRVFQEEQEWDAWEHLYEEKDHRPKVRKMKKERPLGDNKKNKRK